MTRAPAAARAPSRTPSLPRSGPPVVKLLFRRVLVHTGALSTPDHVGEKFGESTESSCESAGD